MLKNFDIKLSNVSVALATLLISPMITQAATAEQRDGAIQKIRSGAIEVLLRERDVSNLDVYLDDIQVNLFAQFSTGKIIITVPFPESRKIYLLKIVDRLTNSVIYNQKIQSTEDIFDKSNIKYSLQSDATYKFDSNQRPRPENYSVKDRTWDNKADLDATFERDDWQLTFAGEATWTDDGNKRLRQNDGSKLDYTRAKGAFKYNNDLVDIALEAGDVGLNGGVDLVNQGMFSRGISTSINLPNYNFKLEFANIYGEDIRGSYRGIDAYERRNRRSGLNASVDLLKSNDHSLTIKGSFLDVVKYAGDNFGVGGVAEGEENTVGGGSFQLSMFERLITVDTDFARSSYANPAELNQLNEFGDSIDVGVTTGNAFKYKVTANPIRSDATNITTFFGYRLVEPLFRSVQSGQAADRETWDYGFSATYKMINLALEKTVFDNNVDDIQSILKTRNRSLNGTATLSLGEFRSAIDAEKTNSIRFLRQLLPSAITFNRLTGAVETLNADVVGANSSFNGSELPNTFSESDTLSLTWDWGNANTSISLNETLFDTRQAGRDTADTEDRSLNFSHSQVFGPVTTDFRLGAGKSENNDITSRSKSSRHSGGLGLTLNFDALPIITTNFDYSRTDDSYLVDDRTGLTTSWNATTVLNFSKYLPSEIESNNAYLTITLMRNETNVRNPFSGAQIVSGYSGVMAFGMKF